MTVPTERPIDHNAVKRFFGGPPLSVIFRLILLSVLVGVILKVLGLDPLNILRSIQELIQTVWNMGFDALVWLWRSLRVGAVIVLRVWFIVPLRRASQGRQSPPGSERAQVIEAGHSCAVIAAAAAPPSPSIPA